MSYNRRKFLQQAGLLSTGVALTAFSSKLMGCSTVKSAISGDPVDSFGLQLYTLRDVLPQDPKGVLKQVASFGYKQLESYEGPKGMFWGMSNKEFSAYLADLGMKAVSSHCDTSKKGFEKKADEAAEIGMKYLISPWLGPNKNIDFYKKAADHFNECGAICKQRGLRFAYHNHDYSFKPVEGQLPQDVMMQATDPASVDYEMDIYWVVAAGQDPIEWFKKYPNRFRLSHIKDKKGNQSTTLGSGTIDFAPILKAGEEHGLQYFLVEQEHYAGTTPVAAVQDSAIYMKNLKF